MIRFFAILLLSLSTVRAVDWTNFYVQPTGSNLNAGSTNANTAAFTYAGGTFVRGTGVFTVGSGNPSSDGVAVGDFASIYTTAGATVATFVARVTARDATTITVSLTAISGAATSVSETAAAATCKIGGAWAGPSGTTVFPFGFVVGTMMNSSSNRVAVNVKGDGDFSTADYSVTASLVANKAGAIIWRGYTTTIGDGGIVNIDGGTSGAVTYYRLLDVTASLNGFENFDFNNNGGTGATNDGVRVNVAETYLWRCSFRNMRRAGVSILARSNLYECHATACNLSNTTAYGAIDLRADGCMAWRCVSRDNTAGASAHGFATSGSFMVECISESNSGNGCHGTGDKIDTFEHCDFYNNTGDGIKLGTATGSMVAVIENCNFVKNGGYGVNFQGVNLSGVFQNCGFGSGTQANTSGQYSTAAGIVVSGHVTYGTDLTPWTDPANGDFRISLAAAKAAGRGVFSTFGSGANATVGYPDIGSGQSLATATDRTYRLNYPRMRR